MNDQKPMIVYAKSESKTFAKSIIRAPVLKVPSTVKLFLRMFADNSYLLRLHNMDTTNAKGVINFLKNLGKCDNS
jgi:hypothetical protein